MERFSCGQVADSVNIPYNQAFLEEGGLAPSNAANVVNSFKGRVIVVVGNRANYPAKVCLSSWVNSLRKTKTLQVQYGFWYISLPSLHNYDVKVPNLRFSRSPRCNFFSPQNFA